MGQKLLLIDDCDSVHALLRVRLRDEELEIRSASDGPSGIEVARSWMPDLILLDVDMPEMDGFEVCRQLKADPQTMAASVIFLTGHAASDEKIRGLELGAVDYISKPFDPAELKARVRATLRTKYLVDLLSKKAMIDGLTGLYNRAYFDSRLVNELSQARRSGQPLACLMLDIDRFKSLNDTHGHPFGDEVLRRIAIVLAETVRSEDIVCRYGGEEFGILLPNTSPVAARALAERIRESVAACTLHHNSYEVNVTCSVGVASVQHGDVPPLLVELADQALYQAKHEGRNRVRAA